MEIASSPMPNKADSGLENSTSSSIDDHARIQLQKQRIHDKFDQIRRQRQEAHVVQKEAQQRQRNQKADEQIVLLMQTDERLASLLSQAADSLCTLLPREFQDTSVDTPSDGLPTQGAKAFEMRAQQWFSTLSEVQYTLRSAVRHLRESQLAPLTSPVGPEARFSGLAGSCCQGHNLSLMDAFVDMSASDGATFTLSNSQGLIHPSLPASETRLSMEALRQKEHNWKLLAQSLEQVSNTLASPSVSLTSPSSNANRTKGSHDAAIVEALRAGSNTDKLLLDALLQVNHISD